MKFLEAVADRYAGRSSLERTCFVFPNRRSATFFKRYLGMRAGRPLFVPNALTIDELFARIAGKEETRGKAQLLYVLYREYVRLMPRPEGVEPESFDQFIFWGDILLSDFDDLDKYLVDARRLLINLRDLKALSVDYDFLTEDQKRAIAAFCNSFFEIPGQAGNDKVGQAGNDKVGHAGNEVHGTRREFAALWDILYPLYSSFREALRAEGMAYAGMIYRDVAESLPTAGPLLPECDEFVFIGLNALNACEKRLLDHLRKEGRADFYWDYFGSMVTDPDNLAGRFIRENRQRYPSKDPFDCPARDPQQQHFEVIRVPSAVGQTRKAMQILTQLHQDGSLSQLEETAVVLPDENLLFPMLGAIPAGIEKVNVTMGYSLSASSGAQVFQLLERLQADARQRDGSWGFYHRDVTDLLEHPYFAAAADPETVAAFKKDIREHNRIFVPAESLSEQGGLFAVVFRVVERTGEIPAYLKSILEQMQAGQDALEREFLYYYHQAVTELEQAGLPLDTLEPRTWYRLLSQYVALVKIPFEGEPLSGLQVMGPLETRALDFRNVIMLSVGEGIFPSHAVSASFLPYNLRVGFGLPTYEQQDAIWAYYFYRSICRAERVYLLYDSRTEGLQSGEESRFIKQLKYLYEVPMVEKVATYALSSTGTTPAVPCVEKTPAVLAELSQMYLEEQHAFSASALNMYLDCPLRFYYEKVRGIEEQDEVVEDLDASLFGSIFHAVMQHLYEPFVGGEFLPDTLRALRRDRNRIDALIDKAFAEQKITEISGENLILRDLIRHFVLRILEVDAAVSAEGGPLVLHGVEMDAGCRLRLPDGRVVRLYGVIDRLDGHSPDVLRVVDYKSGSVQGKDNCDDVNRLFDRSLGTRRPSVAFQLYFYALLKTRMEDDPAVRFEPCVYSLRSIFSPALPKSYALASDKLAQFETRLTELVEELLDPGAPFVATECEDHCQYCPFKRLCNRQ